MCVYRKRETREKRPGQALVLTRLVEVMLVEALRSAPADLHTSGLLAGLRAELEQRALGHEVAGPARSAQPVAHPLEHEVRSPHNEIGGRIGAAVEWLVCQVAGETRDPDLGVVKVSRMRAKAG